jgi:hypothetical protein
MRRPDRGRINSDVKIYLRVLYIPGNSPTTGKDLRKRSSSQL